MPAELAPRIHSFDWLRTLAVLGAVVAYTLLPFANIKWFVQNEEQSNVLAALILVFQTWRPPQKASMPRTRQNLEL
jgi:hypothetical protein